VGSRGASADEEVFSFVPQEGLLNPSGSMDIRFIFDPPPEKRFTNDIESLWEIRWSFSTTTVQPLKIVNKSLQSKTINVFFCSSLFQVSHSVTGLARIVLI
jgi:hypothetical protein